MKLSLFSVSDAGYWGQAALDVPYLEIQIGHGEWLASIAAELGATVMRVFAAYETDGHSPQSLRDGVVRTLQEMGSPMRGGAIKNLDAYVAHDLHGMCQTVSNG